MSDRSSTDAPAAQRPVPAPTGAVRPRAHRTWAAALAAAAAFAVVAWSTLDRSGLGRLPHVTASNAPDPLSTAVPTRTIPADDGTIAPPPTEPPLRIPAAVDRGLGIAAALVVAAIIAWALLRVWQRTRHEPEPGEPEAPGLDLVALTEERAAHQAAALQEGSARNAIVATWVDLERLVSRAGVPGSRARTSSELVIEVLAGHDVDRGALEDLAALYREARFSRHETPEAARERAAADLARIHEGLRIGSAATAVGPKTSPETGTGTDAGESA